MRKIVEHHKTSGQKKIKAVLYNNDFGTMTLPKFTGIQANIFMLILNKLRGMIKEDSQVSYYQAHPESFFIEIGLQESLDEFKLKSNNRKNINNALDNFAESVLSSKTSSFKNSTSGVVYNLFAKASYNKTDLKVWIIPDAKVLSMFRNFSKGNFTKIPLLDYYGLSGIYEKALFRYLSRFANAPTIDGKQHLFRISKDELCDRLHISKKSSYYKKGTLKSLILDRSIKVLRYYFKDLSVKCTCTNKHNVFHTYYSFYWTEDLRTKLLAPEQTTSPIKEKEYTKDDLTLPF